VDAETYITEHRAGIPGWFDELDARMFLASDRASSDHGDLLEIGAYVGKSAILLGFLTQPDEEAIVVDLFDAPAPTAEQRAEQARWYAGLTRDAFMTNWRRFHEREPRVLVGRSDEMLPQLASSSCRLIHVDGSHEYDAVRTDIANALRVATANAVLVFDDIIGSHTPGVTAAVWGTALEGLIVPLLQTRSKLFATVPGSSVTGRALAEQGSKVGVQVVESHRVAEFEVWEVTMPTTPQPRSRFQQWLPPVAYQGWGWIRDRRRR
jgi:hypothetical protein